MVNKILMIIASQNFRDEEYLEPKQVFEQNGFQVFTASSKLELAKGALGAEVKPDITLENIAPDDFDAVVFVGGVGAEEYFNSPDAHQIAQEFNKHGKIIAAICIAPTILANAGLLKNRQATCFDSVNEKLVASGANILNQDVVADDKIVTACGPQAAKKFAQTIIAKLNN